MTGLLGLIVLTPVAGKLSGGSSFKQGATECLQPLSGVLESCLTFRDLRKEAFDALNDAALFGEGRQRYPAIKKNALTYVRLCSTLPKRDNALL